MAITIKEYAEERGQAYESVRKKVRRYESELEGHISEGRPQKLDEYAIVFLDEHSLDRTVVETKNGRIKDLEDTVAKQAEKITELYEENRKLWSRVVELTAVQFVGGQQKQLGTAAEPSRQGFFKRLFRRKGKTKTPSESV